MKKILRKKTAVIVAAIVIAALLAIFIGIGRGKIGNGKPRPMVVRQFLEEAKKNTNWKYAFATGEQEQIVFMNVSPLTNPSNEIGVEVHTFDQVIIIAQGNAKVILNGKTSCIEEGDMIFIPKGVSHNVINMNKEDELKLISFYSETDIPKGAIYKRKADQKED